MVQPMPRNPKDVTNKSMPPKPRSTSRRANAPSTTIKGENVVGSVEARDNATVTFNQNIRNYTPLSEDAEIRRKQKSELKELENAIQRKLTDWQRLVKDSKSGNGNPFLFMQPFGFGDGDRFLGRRNVAQELLDHLQEHIATFLDGSGKTSLLQAAMIPLLLNKGHLPLLVSVSSEPLEISIKKQLLPNIREMDFLQSMSLTEFVRRVSDQLKNGRLFLLVDQFEDFFDQSKTFRSAFEAEWKLCVSGSAPDVHWLFSLPTGSTYLLNMFKDKVAINPNLITLQPLEREEARQAMLGQAKLREIQIDQPVADAILNELGNRSKSVIDPSQLQLVCYMLAGGKGPLVTRWTMQHYNNLGKVDGILRGYLDYTINDLEPVQREPAWQLLATLTDPSEKITNEAELIQKMRHLEVDEEVTRNVLRYLKESHLVEYTTAYKLSSDRLRPSIQEWRDKRTALEKAKEEVWRQVRSIGGSGLRGLLGGALGFMLSYWLLPYVERVPISNEFFFQWYMYPLTMRAMVGAFAGFAMILAIDLSLASFKGGRNKWRFPAGALAGSVCLAWALAFHIQLHYSGNQRLVAMENAALEGAIWGLGAGAGAVWTLISVRHIWLKFFITCVVSGLLLALSDLFWKGLDVSVPFSVVFISGMVLPLFLIGSALIGKPQTRKDG
jgi:hypothetical protein